MDTSLDDPYPSVLLAYLTDLPVSFFIVNGISILVLLFFSGLISGSEVAFFSLNHDQILSSKSSEKK
ncbi:MAG: gliding motility-associated protein GldE, partial [Cyclobacteriaceae bacterium]